MITMNQKLPKIDLQGVVMRVEALRNALGMTKGDFSRSWGLDASSYSKLLDEAKPLKSDHAFAISTLYGVSMDFIYRGDMSRLDDSLRAKIINNLNQGQA